MSQPHTKTSAQVIDLDDHRQADKGAQLEDGFTRIANELVEQFATLNLSKYEWRILWVVLRKTYGWNKKYDAISVSQIEEMTGLDRRNASRAKRGLIEKSVILERAGKLTINKQHQEWNVSAQTTQDVVYRDTRPKIIGRNYFPDCIGVKKKRGNSVFCELCTEDTPWHETESHHIVPRSLGGIDQDENRVRLCKKCHKDVHQEMKERSVVSLDDMPDWYRHFVSRLSSIQTHFMSSVETPQKTVYKQTTKDNTSLSEKISDEDKRCAKWMFGLIQELNPKAKAPNLNTWANDVRLMRERDQRTHREIAKAFKWANNDPFWRSNILSPAKLREKFDVITLRMAEKLPAGKSEKFDPLAYVNAKRLPPDAPLDIDALEVIDGEVLR